MRQAIKELEKLKALFLWFREQAAISEENFRGLDVKKESEMRGCKIAFGQACGLVHQVIEGLKKTRIANKRHQI